MNLRAHPRGPPGELETPQLLCRPSASLGGPRGAARQAGSLNNGAGQRTLCAFPPAPAEPQDWPLQLQPPRAFPLSRLSPRVNALQDHLADLGEGPLGVGISSTPISQVSLQNITPWWLG